MKIHLTGIGGVGMAALAVLLKRRGHEIDGCDLKSTPRTRWLESLGIRVLIGHDPAHVAGRDLVVATPAVAGDNPERLAASDRIRCRGEVLAKIVNSAADSIAVCGSHGKTTTSTFIAKLLAALGEKVEWAIGGETGAFPVAGCRGGSADDGREPVIVVEADESDGTLALYRAKTLVVTNCEYDHPDHFPTPADYFACFEKAKAQSGKVFEGGAVAAELDADPNATLAMRVALERGHGRAEILAALSKIMTELPDRRFQRFAEGVYTDYGHHPTEIRYALTRARALLESGGRAVGPAGDRPILRVLFQPHRYSRTRALLADFARSLELADELVLCPTYSAFEKPLEGGSSADLYAEIRRRGKVRVFLARSCAEAWEHAVNSMRKGDVTMIQGAGDIVEVLKGTGEEQQADYSKKEQQAGRIWIGAGTNTWKSDLELSVEYVKTEGPAGETGCTAKAAGRPMLELAPWMVGIPGTIGGWVKMNAGAHGHSISEVIEAVKVSGRWIPASDCGFGYRTSAIEGEIEDVRFRPAADTSGWLTAEEYLAKRRKFPAYTKGSVFKNPPGDSAGRLLEEAGCKGLRVGGAYVWKEHANVIVAPPEQATASDFLALAELMRERVRFRSGIELEPEVRGLT